MTKQEQSAFNNLMEVCQDALANADMEYDPDISLPNYIAMTLAVTTAEAMTQPEPHADPPIEEPHPDDVEARARTWADRQPYTEGEEER